MSIYFFKGYSMLWNEINRTRMKGKKCREEKKIIDNGPDSNVPLPILINSYLMLCTFICCCFNFSSFLSFFHLFFFSFICTGLSGNFERETSNVPVLKKKTGRSRLKRCNKAMDSDMELGYNKNNQRWLLRVYWGFIVN